MPASATPPRLVKLSLPPLLSVAAVAALPGETLPAFVEQTHADPDPAQLSMQMCQVLFALGQEAFALEMQARALAHRAVYRFNAPSAPTLRLLALMVPGNMMANAPLDFVIDLATVQFDVLYLGADGALPDEVPDHDVLIVAISESEAHQAQLAALVAPLRDWPRPVLNRPERIGRCARHAVGDWLNGVPGLIVPRTRRWQRSAGAPEPGTATFPLGFPLTMRPIDTHAGQGLAKIDAPPALQAYMAERAEDAFFVSDFVDYRSADGHYRKWRIALIDGQPYGCHLAISDDWMVHYHSAGMDQHAERRAEEAQQLADFDTGFGARHGAALRAIAARLALDYLVLDCADTPDGALLLFEVDNSSWIHAIDPVDLYPYKPVVMRRAFKAFGAMLSRRLR